MRVFQRACERRGGRERHGVGVSCSCKAPGGLCSSFYLGGGRPTVYKKRQFQNVFRTLPVVSPRPCAFCPFSLSSNLPRRFLPVPFALRTRRLPTGSRHVSPSVLVTQHSAKNRFYADCDHPNRSEDCLSLGLQGSARSRNSKRARLK